MPYSDSSSWMMQMAIPMALPLLLWLGFGLPYINFLKRKMYRQYIREDGPQSHYSKAGTPTMGGVLILFAAFLPMLFYLLRSPHLLTPELILVVLVLLIFGGAGFLDDYLKVAKKKNKGLSGWSKLAIQIAVGGAIGVWAVSQSYGHANVSLFGLGWLDLGWFYPIFTALIITGASNAFNLTDGLDGLAGLTGCITFVILAFFFLGQPDLRLISFLLAGSCAGFAAFNRHPAKIFMGDTGSLALGGAIGALAVLGKIELYLLFIAGIYVIETLSVILQVVYFKATRGRRIFKMSPLHHHFELSGWGENRIVLTFAAVQAVFGLTAIFIYYGNCILRQLIY